MLDLKFYMIEEYGMRIENTKEKSRRRGPPLSSEPRAPSLDFDKKYFLVFMSDFEVVCLG